VSTASREVIGRWLRGEQMIAPAVQIQHGGVADLALFRYEQLACQVAPVAVGVFQRDPHAPYPGAGMVADQ